MSIERFLEIQNPVYATVLTELAAGQKVTHWMWFIFPQLKELGTSHMSTYYGLDGTDEVQAFWENDFLRRRWMLCMELVIRQLKEGKTLVDIFGEVDAMKCRSSAELFLPYSSFPPSEQRLILES